MYTLVLATVLASGQAAPAADLEQDVRDLKQMVKDLREQQKDARLEELKLVIAGLRQRITDEKLDEIRRDVRLLQEEEAIYGAAPWPVPSPSLVPSTTRATIRVQVPVGATFIVNDRPIPVPAVNPTFVTPPLEPGRDYFYDCKVTVLENGKLVTRIKHVKVRAGELIRIDYVNMEAQ